MAQANVKDKRDFNAWCRVLVRRARETGFDTELRELTDDYGGPENAFFTEIYKEFDR